MGNTFFVKGERVCKKPYDSENRGYSKLKTSYHAQRMSKFCQRSKLLVFFAQNYKNC